MLRLDTIVIMRRARGRGFEGAVIMKGCITGEAQIFRAVNPKMLEMDCFGDCLSLVAQGLIKKCKRNEK